MSTPPKRKHGHDRDATQLTSSGSVPTRVAPNPTLSLASGVFGGAPRSGQTNLLSNTALGSSTTLTLCFVSGRRFRVKEPFLISIADVSRAHVYADAVRDVYVRSANEAPKAKELGVCVEKLRRRCTDPWVLLNGGENITPRSWRREDFPEARLLRATSSMKACRPTSWCMVTSFS